MSGAGARRTARRRAAVLVPFLVTGLLGGCDDLAPTPDSVRRQIERQLPGARFATGEHLRLGRAALLLARGVLHLAEPDEELPHRVLAHLRRVEIATYEVLSLPDLSGLEAPSSLLGAAAESGWAPVFAERDEGSRTWIYAREDAGGVIRNLYVVELDDSELTIVDLAGRLDRVVAELVADDPRSFAAAFGA